MNTSWLIMGSILLLLSLIIFIGVNFRFGFAALGLGEMGLVCALPSLAIGILIIILGILAPKGPGLLK